MITKNIGMLLLAIYLIAVGIVTLTGLGIGIITGAAGRNFYPDRALNRVDHANNSIICVASFGPIPLSSCLK